jgi:hypothetical protein
LFHAFAHQKLPFQSEKSSQLSDMLFPDAFDTRTVDPLRHSDSDIHSAAQTILFLNNVFLRSESKIDHVGLFQFVSENLTDRIHSADFAVILNLLFFALFHKLFQWCVHLIQRNMTQYRGCPSQILFKIPFSLGSAQFPTNLGG